MSANSAASLHLAIPIDQASIADQGKPEQRITEKRQLSKGHGKKSRRIGHSQDSVQSPDTAGNVATINANQQQATLPTKRGKKRKRISEQSTQEGGQRLRSGSIFSQAPSHESETNEQHPKSKKRKRKEKRTFRSHHEPAEPIHKDHDVSEQARVDVMITDGVHEQTVDGAAVSESNNQGAVNGAQAEATFKRPEEIRQKRKRGKKAKSKGTPQQASMQATRGAKENLGPSGEASKPARAEAVDLPNDEINRDAATKLVERADPTKDSTTFESHTDQDSRLKEIVNGVSTEPVSSRKRRYMTSSQVYESKQHKRELKTAKRERRSQRRMLKDINTAGALSDEDEAASTALGKRISKGPHGYKKPPTPPLWAISDEAGGHLLDMDPLFDADENYILMAFNSAVHVYKAMSSLLLQRLRLRDVRDTVSGFAFSATDPAKIYVGTRSGFIEMWDWKEGKRLGSWNTRCSVRTVATAAASPGSTLTNNFVYTSDETFGGHHPCTITAHRLFAGSEAEKTDLKTLLKHDKPVDHLQIFSNGKYIAATSANLVFLGATSDSDPARLSDLVYIWRQISFSEQITSIDIRHRESQPVSNSSSKKGRKSQTSQLDIAIGTLGGVIYIHRDLLGQLIAHESDPTMSVGDPEKLHWHRNAVFSVKWSKDGNYLISGGQETVLIIHQLSTGRKQYLPNLMAPIRCIKVSPSGTSYAISLADNSAMIISTTELKPTFSIAGLRISQSRANTSRTPTVATVDNPYPGLPYLSRLQFPTTIHSLHKSRLLMAIPSSTEPSASQSATYLQTVDIPSATGLTTQALTRNTAATKNIAPDAASITTPNVTHISISRDGNWLATVDEWAPPLKDIESMAFDHEQALQDQASKKEVYLKIWSAKLKSSEWELSTRFDEVHPPNLGISPSILALTSDPSLTEFATFATDGSLRFWCPSRRIRDGQPVTDESGKALTNWRCAQTVYLTAAMASPAETKVPQAGYLAYSQDGTVCAAGYRIADPQKIFIVDTVSGNIAVTITSSFPSPLLLGLGMLLREVVLFHPGELEMHDLVDNRVSLIPLPKMAKSKDARKVLEGAKLAVDADAGTIAVGFLDRPKGNVEISSSKGRLQIFDTGNQDPTSPVYEKTFHHGIADILCSHPPSRDDDLKAASDDDGISSQSRRNKKQGFVIIDRAAQICTLTPSATSISSLNGDLAPYAPQQVPTPPPSDDAASSAEKSAKQGPLAFLFQKAQENAQASTSASEQPPAMTNSSQEPNDEKTQEDETWEALVRDVNDKIPAPEFPVVSQEKLAEVFDNAAVAGNGFLPPVNVLFRDIVALVTGRST